jgi:5-methyltetrahydrofolate--homocysteine methyltransferase
MLESLLAAGRPLLADGAMGANLSALGLASGECTELWNETERDKVFSLQRRFVEAGADVILTNSFGANRRRRVRDLNRRAAEIAREAAERASGRATVAGSVGPTGDLLAPLGPLSEGETVDVFIEQIEGRKEGADIAWIETMSAPDEMSAAAEAATAVGMPYAVTASFATAGKTMMGLAPEALADLTEGFAPSPLLLAPIAASGRPTSLSRSSPSPRSDQTRSSSPRPMPASRNGMARISIIRARRP